MWVTNVPLFPHYTEVWVANIPLFPHYTEVRVANGPLFFQPWDDTEVWVAELDAAGSRVKEGTCRKVAGGVEESAIEPGWTASNQLLYVSDKTNWWNLYHVAADDNHVNLRPESSEIAGPQWQFGKTAYVADPSGSSKILTAQDCVSRWTALFVMYSVPFRSDWCPSETKRALFLPHVGDSIEAAFLPRV